MDTLPCRGPLADATRYRRQWSFHPRTPSRSRAGRPSSLPASKPSNMGMYRTGKDSPDCGETVEECSLLPACMTLSATRAGNSSSSRTPGMDRSHSPSAQNAFDAVWPDATEGHLGSQEQATNDFVQTVVRFAGAVLKASKDSASRSTVKFPSAGFPHDHDCFRWACIQGEFGPLSPVPNAEAHLGIPHRISGCWAR